MKASLGGEGERPRNSVLGRGMSEGFGVIAKAGHAKLAYSADRLALPL